MRIDVEITKHGGIFEYPDRIVDEGIEAMRRHVGDEGVKMIRRRLDQVLQNPSGYYRSRIDYTLRSDEIVELHDSGVVYGPWLEGVSSRNAASRFKGYATFRKTLQDLDQKAAEIAAEDIDYMAGRLES